MISSSPEKCRPEKEGGVVGKYFRHPQPLAGGGGRGGEGNEADNYKSVVHDTVVAG